MPRMATVLRSADGHENGSGGFRSLRSPALDERIYRGIRSPEHEYRVWFEDGVGGRGDKEQADPKPLPLHREIRDHSPTGFTWGYGGSGPAQLALALLSDALGDPELAQDHYQAFKWAFVAKWGDSWTITAREIREFVFTGTERAENRSNRRRPRFSSGGIVATPNALCRLPVDEIMTALARHLSGDWGELDEEDWQANEDALRNGGRLLSAYRAANHEKFWIITESDRACTTVLLPEDY